MQRNLASNCSQDLDEDFIPHTTMVRQQMPFKNDAEKLEMVQKRLSKGFQNALIKDTTFFQPFYLIKRKTGLTVLQCRRCFPGENTKGYRVFNPSEKGIMMGK